MLSFKWIINIFKSKKKKNGVMIEMEVPKEVVQPVKKDPKEIILNDSVNRLLKLKVYSEYFKKRVIFDILARTEIIHDVFNSNDGLTYKKLEQFHYYYTDHLFELLDKIKSAQDENIALINAEIKSIDNTILSYNKKISKFSSFDTKKIVNNKMQYAQHVSLELVSIFNCLVDGYKDFRFKPHNKFNTYTSVYGLNLSWILPENIFNDLIVYDYLNNYKYENFHIERKLMGKLQKNLFAIDFFGNLNCGESYIELFKISEIDTYFIYIPDLAIFKIIEYRKIQDYCNDNNTIYGDLCLSIDKLEEKKVDIKTSIASIKQIDEKTQNVLLEYLNKISDMELINSISDIDLQRKNLQTILELTKLEI